ncbi:MAG: hypothetical protein M3Y39_20750 [Chloroflexota bacterium]|nr:hypothetical protein [Chloroflexota bacterium]
MIERQTIIPFRPRKAQVGGKRFYEDQTQEIRPLRPRYRPFHQPLSRARLEEDERDIWQMLPPHVAEFLRTKLELARALKRQAEVVVEEVAEQEEEMCDPHGSLISSSHALKC